MLAQLDVEHHDDDSGPTLSSLTDLATQNRPKNQSGRPNQGEANQAHVAEIKSAGA